MKIKKRQTKPVFFQSEKPSSDKTLSELQCWLQISSDESTLPCIMQRILQKFCCCSKNVRCVVSLTLVTRIGCICNTHGNQREICDGLEIKLTWPLSWIQQAGAPITSAKSVTPIVLLVVIDYRRSDKACIGLKAVVG